MTLFHFIQFFGGNSGLGYDVTDFFWEAVVQSFHVANADHVAYFVPVIVGIKAVAGFWFLLVVEFAVAAV